MACLRPMSVVAILLEALLGRLRIMRFQLICVLVALLAFSSQASLHDHFLNDADPSCFLCGHADVKLLGSPLPLPLRSADRPALPQISHRGDASPRLWLNAYRGRAPPVFC